MYSIFSRRQAKLFSFVAIILATSSLQAAVYTQQPSARLFVNGGFMSYAFGNGALADTTWNSFEGGSANVGVLWTVAPRLSLGGSFSAGLMKDALINGLKQKPRFFNISTLLNYAFSSQVSARATLGLDVLNIQSTLEAIEPQQRISTYTNALSLGAGLGYHFTNNLSARVDYTYSDFALYTNRVQLGLEWQFS